MSRPEPPSPLWQHGWYQAARHLQSPNHGPRPDGVVVDLLVLHGLTSGVVSPPKGGESAGGGRPSPVTSVVTTTLEAQKLSPRVGKRLGCTSERAESSPLRRSDGSRTRYFQLHRQALYQVSYACRPFSGVHPKWRTKELNLRVLVGFGRSSL